MENLQTNKVLSVSELTHSIKTILEMQYRFVHIQGEVSNLRVPFSGHSYFTLKDNKAQIRAVLFKGQQRYLQEKIRDGQSVVCHGRISLYEPRGEYQIIVDTVDFSGAGHLQLEFERLKNKLAREGLFSEGRKKMVPRFAEHIVLITSPTGAAVHDFLKIVQQRRYPGKISILPVAVQGDKSAGEIVEALTVAHRETEGEIIVLLRGGGSLEDLWSFNEEMVARTIHSCPLPVVTGIGHEIDFTIADMCADLHTHTPTAAAEELIPDSMALLADVTTRKHRIASMMSRVIGDYGNEVHNLLRIIGDLDLYLSHYSLRLDHQLSLLLRTMEQKMSQAASMVENELKRLHHQAPSVKINIQQQKVNFFLHDISSKIYRQLERKKEQLGYQAALLDSVSPLAVLARGYAVARDESGTVITDAEQVNPGERLDVRLLKGEMLCEVIESKKIHR